MTSTTSSNTNQPDKSTKLLNLLRRVNTTNNSTSVQRSGSSNNDSKNEKMKMPLTKKGIRKFKDKLKYTQKLRQLEMKKKLMEEIKKERSG